MKELAGNSGWCSPRLFLRGARTEKPLGTALPSSRRKESVLLPSPALSSPSLDLVRTARYAVARDNKKEPSAQTASNEATF
jgi:hypothetical protein